MPSVLRLRPHVAVFLSLAGLGLLAVGCGPPAEPSEIENVLVVMIDTLRADHLETYGYEKPTSPFLESFSRRAVVFEDASSTAPQTVPSVLSLWSGVYPSRHGNQYYPATDSFHPREERHPPQVPSQLPLLAELFRERGFATAAVMTNPWLREQWGFDRGFDRYEHIGHTARAAAVNAAALELLDDLGDAPFLLYLHYMDVHYPYRPSEEHFARMAKGLEGNVTYFNGSVARVRPEDVAFTRAAYDACVRTVDDELRNLVEALDARGLLDTTALVILSDHGEEFYEHRGFGHGHTLFREMVHVPLLFAHPSFDPRRVPNSVSLVDVLPTLIDLTGGSAPQGIAGVSLAPLLRGNPGAETGPRPVFHEVGPGRAIQRQGRKLIREGTRERAFDLVDDPQEQAPLDRAPWIGSLRRELDAFLARTVPVASEEPAPSTIEVGSELETQLEALGYLSHEGPPAGGNRSGEATGSP